LTAAEGRKFAFTVGLAFLVLAALTWWRGHPTLRTVFGMTGAVLLLAGAVAPDRLGPVYRGWMALAHAISKVTTPVFMGVVFFVVITPIGLVMRLVGRRPLRHKERDGGFWMAPASGGRSDLQRQF
jgi:hypothetical protein